LAQWYNEHSRPSKSAKESFVKEVILKDAKVKDINAKKWGAIRKIHPNTQKSEFEIWSRWIWEQYLRYKMKPLAKKKKETNSNGQNSLFLMTDETPIQ